jgi:hypothetical protein
MRRADDSFAVDTFAAAARAPRIAFKREDERETLYDRRVALRLRIIYDFLLAGTDLDLLSQKLER